MSKAYLAGNVNQAMVNREDGLYVLDGATKAASRLDGYTFSQWRLSRQEIKEIEVGEESEIFAQLYMASEQAAAMTEALELMDVKLSERYRLVVAESLTGRIKVHEGLLDHLRNRFYSNRLPEDFDELLAIEVAIKFSSSLTDLYKDLRKKTELFDTFYTKFWLGLRLPEPQKTYIDEQLSDLSAFAHFTNALYLKSATLYDYASSIAIKAFEDLDLPVERGFFAGLRAELLRSGKFWFNDTMPFERLLREHLLINVKPYRFFGSPLKTIYNYSSGQIPFSTEQTVKVLYQTHFPFLIQGVPQEEHEQKLYWQSMNDLDFFSSVGKTWSLVNAIQEPKITEVQRCVKMIDHHYLNRHFQHHIPAKRLEDYSALLYADCAFMMQDYDDAVILYSDLKSIIGRSKRSRTLYDQTILHSGVMVRLGKTYEMLNEFKKAKSLYLQAFRLINAFIAHSSAGNLVALIEIGHADANDLSYEPTNVEYAEAMASKLADFIATTEIKGS